MIQFAKIYRMPTSRSLWDWRTGYTHCIHHVKKVVPPTCLAASSAQHYWLKLLPFMSLGPNSCRLKALAAGNAHCCHGKQRNFTTEKRVFFLISKSNSCDFGPFLHFLSILANLLSLRSIYILNVIIFVARHRPTFSTITDHQ